MAKESPVQTLVPREIGLWPSSYRRRDIQSDNDEIVGTPPDPYNSLYTGYSIIRSKNE
jgi:hypothetical protein